MCLISPISCWHVSPLSRHFVWLMNKRQSLHHSQSKVVCQNFFNLWLLNAKKSLPLTDSDVQTLLGEEENQNTKRKAETYIFSAFGNEIFHGWERKSSTRRFTLGRFWHVPEIFLPSVRTNSIAENFIYWKLGPLFAFVVISSWLRQHTLRFLFGDSRSFYCHLLMKSTFLVSEGLLSLYDKQNNTWLLVDMKFFFSFLNRHLIRSLRLLVSYRVKYSKRNSISSAPRYYFTIYCAAGVFLGSNVNMNFLTTRIPFFWYD